MHSEYTNNGSQVIVKLSGSIYVEDAAKLRENLLSHIEQGHNNFLLDLEKVDYIDSSGLGVLVAINKRTLQNRGKLIIKGINGLVKELFELTRLTKVFEIQYRIGKRGNK